MIQCIRTLRRIGIVDANTIIRREDKIPCRATIRKNDLHLIRCEMLTIGITAPSLAQSLRVCTPTRPHQQLLCIHVKVGQVSEAPHHRAEEWEPLDHGEVDVDRAQSSPQIHHPNAGLQWSFHLQHFRHHTKNGTSGAIRRRSIQNVLQRWEKGADSNMIAIDKSKPAAAGTTTWAPNCCAAYNLCAFV